MPRKPIESFRDGDAFDDVYLAADKQHRTNKNGNPYLQLELRDRTGGISARMWNAGDQVFRAFENGDFLHVEGKVQLFQGTLQTVITYLERVEAEKVDVSEFMPHTDKDVGQLTAKLWALLRSMANPHLKALAECFRMDERFLAAFTTAPAGVKLHHAFVAGLLEHTVTMMEIAEKLLPFYPGVDRDLILCGIFLHDAGKVRELSFGRAFGYTDEGQLLGHIVLGAEMVGEMAAKAVELTGEPFPRELLLRLKHMVLSHHGTLEYGSPKVPMTPEAVFLHEIDSLDTRMHMVLRDVRDDAKNLTAWTPWNATLGRRFYKGGANGDLFGEVREVFD